MLLKPHGGVSAQRILHVEYSLPRHVTVSPECQDLLRRILVAEPERRITMEQIQRHPWCLHDLPEGVAELNSKLLSQPEEIDPEGVQVGAQHQYNLYSTRS